ncbi:LysR family transcriptional regulator [Halomicronema hongdechloris C2206]|uniref:LysR family transcriptional regulator n=1 Tax=Halomicronema hongdechloris C2206 TaxID=1641165 RepID=A0A1Z3HPD6_9CYAN|nr:LysR family transcriptional regulator [Halomicronema hongdechloris C2206]
MRLEHLQAFLSVAATGSFQKAAQECNVTQSTISRQIQTLEAELGTSLFHRTSQAKLTIAGDCLLPQARKISQAWAQAVQEIDTLMAGKQPELCVAAIQSVCAYFLPPILQQFCQVYPEVQLRVTALGSDRSLKVLRDGLVDVAIVMENPLLTTGPEMVVDVLYEEPIQVLMAAEHPLSRCSAVPWAELVHRPQVMFKDGYGMQRLVKEQFQRYGVEPKTVLELNTLEAFRGIVRQGQLIALLPQSALIDSQQDETLAIRPTEDPPLVRRVLLVTTQDRVDIPPIQRFCALVRGANQRIISAVA